MKTVSGTITLLYYVGCKDLAQRKKHENNFNQYRYVRYQCIFHVSRF